MNFLTCHDGFTMYDLFAYNDKHNEANGWGGTDGSWTNFSWNCGVEGETDDPGVNALRMRMIRNSFALLMCSRGIPMFLSGDEFCNTQFGNNNAYCQDNITSWLDWNRLDEHQDMFEFFKYMIAFRKAHKVLRKNLSDGAMGLPNVSYHGVTPWHQGAFGSEERYLGVMFSGYERDKGAEVIYVASNAYWDGLDITLPELPLSMHWEIAVNTWHEHQTCTKFDGRGFHIGPRSVMVFVGK